MWALGVGRWVLGGCVVSAALFAAAGCNRAGAERGPVEIRYWTGWSGHELDTQKALVEDFNRTHPGIRVRVLSVFNSYQKVRIAFAGGATPDVCSAVWADELASYAMRGVLRPLDADLTASGRSLEEWVPGAARSFRYRGQTYALSVTTNTNFIVYNKQRFREVGLDPEKPPRTIAELDHASDLCTVRGPRGTLERYGMRPQELHRWAYAFGGGWYDAGKEEVTANHPGNVAALRWMQEYARRYGVSQMQNFEASFGSQTSPNGPFFVGKTAMWQTGEFAREHLRRYAPEMEYGYFPFPIPPGGRPNSTAATGSVFVIPAATRHPKEAWTFLNWLTGPEAVGRFCEEIANLPPLKKLAAEPRFRKDPMFSFALDLAAGQNVFGAPPMPTWPRYKLEIQRVEEEAIIGGADPQRLLDDLDARMEKELARALRDAS